MRKETSPRAPSASSSPAAPCSSSSPPSTAARRLPTPLRSPRRPEAATAMLLQTSTTSRRLGKLGCRRGRARGWCRRAGACWVASLLEQRGRRTTAKEEIKRLAQCFSELHHMPGSHFHDEDTLVSQTWFCVATAARPAVEISHLGRRKSPVSVRQRHSGLGATR
ncbi:hypothetical protein TOPH_03405 [Tolypocladium ophioglossoides CBS 100239]|uniref:Uncharacterized protein n=1 Tax=Tolypocladium ophioglossoides (strain CBS 100239) TaxID=1163406 RepID=A0A0L0NDE0_TOLOC|nr:hypothetical protein TOPH_03405 [Tolypocladium ophioglossoides CBS 100239]